jgi:hypothetical protein
MPPSFMILIDIVPASAHKQEIDDIVANMSKDDRMINSLLSVENTDPYLKIKKIERDLSKTFFCLIAMCILKLSVRQSLLLILYFYDG